MKLPPTKKLLVERIKANHKQISDWYMEKARLAPPPLYCSIDLRDSGHKIVPVDSNLFPAGFNNICPEDLRTAPPIFRAQIEAQLSARGYPLPQKILVLPESHTSNKFYIENLYFLTQIIRNAGFEVEIGWFGPLPEGVTDRIELESESHKKLTAYPIRVSGDRLTAGEFTPDMILLNNDFSGGYPAELDPVSQPILPSYTLGWHSRKKSEHFRYYNELAAELAEILKIDPWLIQIDTEQVDGVNFNEDQGIEQAAQAVERVLARTQKAYDQHGVTHKPFVFVKNNAGTYGMGIMVVHSADELRSMNRRTKNKMSVGKNRMAIESVAVQEGVPTATIIDRLAAEPVIYMLGYELVGGFLRTNSERGVEENLNSAGMTFRKLCMTDLRESFADDADEAIKDLPVLEMVYGTIARLSALATGLELQRHRRKA